MSLTLIIGPMFSGKSTFLYEKIKELNNTNILVLKHHMDNRYNCDADCIVTHDKEMILAKSIKTLKEVYAFEGYEEAESILIDEGQFFDDLFPFVKVALGDNKKIYVSGLVSDFKMAPFENMLEIMSLADTIIHKKGKCSMCDSDSSFSKRITLDEEQVLIGSDEYVPVCRKCFYL